ncbi:MULTISPECIES: DUF397 domain-containing protein [unclassified Streptomyces]|uniref:DUF397 domain-containing protein n=1 Tax=unclassified Streptomyces TaxID=2593676 RepID=UPI001BE8A510|nr:MULTISPECIES: DUF397 domain-containing protein [unclassified Streptomyces]MBT2402132.1 DUF397 domain-containing protein [Streptomyces sp. ISL-21]MBT2453598.1 DUF397 domain-containing protein [Streptomyces sp. ISL-86]MBT2609319.1 DUF397 domain-containing protein [Streptomyces sp. ISL-87]
MSGTLRWFKSSYSNDSGGACIEVAYDWHKSSYSDSSGGACVEVAACTHAVHVRDSKNPTGPTLAVAAPVWADFAGWAGR